MAEPLFYLLALALALSYPLGIEPLFLLEEGRHTTWLLGLEIPTPLLLTALVVLLDGLWTAGCFTIGLRQENFVTLRRLARRRFFNRLLSLGLFAGIVYALHFPVVVEVPASVTLTTLLRLLPFFIMSGWDLFFGALREADVKGDVPLRALLSFQCKTFLGFALFPILAMLLLLGLLSSVPELERFVAVYPSSVYLVMFGLVVFFLASAPFLLRFVFGAMPVPPGELRRDLKSLCEQADFRYGDMLVVPTHGSRLGNAFIVGLFGRQRHVFFTDYLLQTLPKEQVRSVLAHEIGHAKRHHLLAFLFFSVTSVVFGQTFYSYFAQQGSPLAGIIVPLSTIVWVGGFSFISKRFEIESDVYAVELTRDPDTMMRTLLSVAAINGMPIELGGFRHPSIARRVEMILNVKRQPLFAKLEGALGRTIRGFCLWFFVAALSILVMDAGWQSRDAPARQRQYAAYLKTEQGRRLLFDLGESEAAERVLREAAADSMEGRTWLYLSRAQLGRGDLAEASRSLDLARTKGVADPFDRLLLRDLGLSLKAP